MKAKVNNAKIKAVFSNENEQHMDRISTEMAIYFEERINSSQLAKWVSVANDICICDANELTNVRPTSSFVNSIGLFILPDLIKCCTKEERITHLKENIPFVFFNNDYEGSKELLRDLGVFFLNSYVKYQDEEDTVAAFMGIYTDWLFLCKMYGSYEYFKEALRNENKKEAA